MTRRVLFDNKQRFSFFFRDGESGNILDNLLKRMEQYANNLEVSLTYLYRINFIESLFARVSLKNVQVII
jgi:hypothetical protein